MGGPFRSSWFIFTLRYEELYLIFKFFFGNFADNNIPTEPKGQI